MPGAKEFLRTKKENTILKMQNRFSSSAAFGRSSLPSSAVNYNNSVDFYDIRKVYEKLPVFSYFLSYLLSSQADFYFYHHSTFKLQCQKNILLL